MKTRDDKIARVERCHREIRKLRESQRPDRSSMRPILDRLDEIKRGLR